MAPGDVTTEIVNPNTTDVDNAVTALRQSANDKWGFVPLANGQKIMIIHVEEA